MNYYNEIDPGAVQWLRNLIAAGMIPAGDVDERSITEVQPDDLHGYTQCHFFAGIAGWPLALALAGWPADRPVWTGSCPCQPFSVAGKGAGTADDRHLWPEFRRLISERTPPVVFGEQVASPAGRDWLVGVRADLEALGYAVGAADLCAASVGAPHIRQRLFWGGVRRMGNPERAGLEGHAWHGDDRNQPRRFKTQPPRSAAEASGDSGVANANSHRRDQARSSEPAQELHGAIRNGWDNYDLIPCADGKARRIESGLSPLAHGVPDRVVRLRAYGNAIVPQIAAEFVMAIDAALAASKGAEK